MREDGRAPLSVEYATVPELIELILFAVESVSLGFERWGERYVRGPSLYFVVVTGRHSGLFADALGNNRWPIETCRVIDDELDSFVEVARTVGFEHDGAIIVSADGTLQEQMVRVKSLSPEERDEMSPNIEYPDWMGTKQLSAVETSVRNDVLAVITLSEENGRVTVFDDGKYTDYQRDELGGKWRSSSSK